MLGVENEAREPGAEEKRVQEPEYPQNYCVYLSIAS